MSRPLPTRNSELTTQNLLPDAPVLAEQASAYRSAYLHLPFCARVCPYCDFNVVAGRDDLVERYVAALEREVAEEPEWGPLDAVFVGGGTPSRLGHRILGRLLRRLADRFGLESGAEVTLEANPEDWSDDLAAGLVEAGYTRVSFGAQSLDDDVLARLGRRHRGRDVEVAVASARAAGFASVSLDLILGTPGESVESWERTVEEAIHLQPDHVSAYALTVERGTELSRLVARGEPAPDPDDQAEKWELQAAALEGAGLVRYEVSNAARPGHHCRYNLSVWGRGEYLGLGAGAHGFRDGVRTHNVRRIDAYLARVESGLGPVQGSEVVEGWAAEQERLMLGLRRAAGVATGPGTEALLASADGRRLLTAGVIGVEHGRLVVLRPLLTDAVVRAVLDLEPPDFGVSGTHQISTSDAEIGRVLSVSPLDC